MNRLHDVPIYRIVETTVSVERYHRMRLSLLRFGEPQVYDLRGLRSLALLLESDAWICIDRTMNDLPVVAWTHFRRPDSLDPTARVACRLHHYHAHASLIVDSVLEKADFEIMRRLRQLASEDGCGDPVLPFASRGEGEGSSA